MATKKTPQQVTVDLLADTSRTVDFTAMIVEQQEFVRKAERMAGSKPSKTEATYIEEQRNKLTQLEDIVKRWIWEAFEDDDEIVSKTMYWGEIKKNFNITVLVEKKT